MNFDAERDRHCYFIASDLPSLYAAADVYDYLLIALTAVSDANRHLIDQLLDRGKHVLVDSGIFTLVMDHVRTHGNMTMAQALALPPAEIDGFDALWEKYTTWIPEWEDRLWGYVELDQGGADWKRDTRSQLHQLGLDPIPVYHPVLDGAAYLDELVKDGHQRIAVGNIVDQGTEERLRILATLHHQYPDLWVHALGATPTELLWAYPTGSCDSSSWLSSTRYGRPRAYAVTTMMIADKDFVYRYGYTPETTDEDGAKKSARFGAYEARFLMEAWRDHLAQWRDAPPPRRRKKGTSDA